MTDENKAPETETAGVEIKAETPAAAEAPAAPAAPAEEAAPAEAAAPAEEAAPAAPEAPAVPESPASPTASADPAAPAVEADPEAAAKARAEARAARAAARAAAPAASAPAEEAAPKEPSPLQPRLDRIVELIKEAVSEEAVAEAVLNARDLDLPTLTINAAHLPATAQFLRESQELKLDYLRLVAGVDRETHMETVYYLLSTETLHEYCLKVKIDRETPSVPSVTPVWPTADWMERETFDLLGIDFPGHPDLRRIMMPDDWVGHPLRKDYVPLDPEV